MLREDAADNDAMGQNAEGVADEDAAEHEDTAKNHHLSTNHPAGLLQHHSAEMMALHYNQFARCPVQATRSLKTSPYEGRMLPQVPGGPASSRWPVLMVGPL